MGATPNKIKLVLVEDHPVTRKGLPLALETDGKFEILAEAGTGELAVKIVKEVMPDVVLMDIDLPHMSGIEASKIIKTALPDCKILIFTSHDLKELAVAALEAKCDGYCLKGIDGSQLSLAIVAVLEGGIWLDPSIARKLIDLYVHQPQPTSAKAKNETNSQEILSARKLEVLSCIVDGLTNNEIAAKLSVSAQTIQTHVSHIMEKLSATDRTQAAVKALREGIL